MFWYLKMDIYLVMKKTHYIVVMLLIAVLSFCTGNVIGIHASDSGRPLYKHGILGISVVQIPKMHLPFALLTTITSATASKVWPQPGNTVALYNAVNFHQSLQCGIQHNVWTYTTRVNTSGNNSGPRLNIKTVLSTYGDFHVKDKTAVRTSYL